MKQPRLTWTSELTSANYLTIIRKGRHLRMLRKLLSSVLIAGCVSAGFVGAALAAPPVQSCADIHASDPSALDGNYTIYPNGEQFTVYCANMATSPADYLNLVNTGGSSNYTFNAGQSYNADGNSTTHFTKVRIDPATLTVDVADYTFSTYMTTGSNPKFAGGPLTDYPYGTAAACLSPADAAGTANIDLSGLPFKVASSFGHIGASAAGTATFSLGGQIVNLTGGGYCGGEGAIETGGPYVPLVCCGGSDPYALQLAYIGPEASLDNLIAEFVSNADVAKAMEAQVHSIATAPNAHAKAGKLGAFGNFLAAQTGKSISQEDASTVLRLASAL